MITSTEQDPSTSSQQPHRPGTQEPETRPPARARPRADRYSEQTPSRKRQDRKTKRSRARTEDAHLGIVIHGCGPASGRPEWLADRAHLAVDLYLGLKSIFGEWSGC